MNTPPVPEWTGVATSVVLVVLAAAVVARQRLGLTADLVVAAVRATVQLVAVAAVMLVVFDHAGVPGAVGWVALMALVAGQVAARRGGGLPHVRVVCTAAVVCGAAVSLGLLLATRVVAVQPRVLIPLGGMAVTGAMQAAAVTVMRVVEQARTARAAIEARLCLGLTAQEAFRPYARFALRAAMLPPVDSTRVVGLVSLPGAFAGLILAGVGPLTAVRYQVIVMFLLLAAAAVAGGVAVWLARRVLFDRAHRLRPLAGPRPRRVWRRRAGEGPAGGGAGVAPPRPAAVGRRRFARGPAGADAAG